MTKNSLEKQARANFINYLDTASPAGMEVMIDMVDSNTNLENYVITMTNPDFETMGEAVKYGKIADAKLAITNKSYSWGVQEDRFILDDSVQSLGSTLENKIRQGAQKWRYLPVKELSTNLLRGSATAWDGTAFFSTSRTVDGSANISNIYKAGTALDNSSEILIAFGGAKSRMLGFKDVNGDPYNVDPSWVVVVPPKLADAWSNVMDPRMTMVTNGSITQSNPYAGAAKVVINNYATTSDNSVFLLNANAPKPFIWQTRENPMLSVKEPEDGRYVRFYAIGRGNYSAGAFTGIVKISTGA